MITFSPDRPHRVMRGRDVLGGVGLVEAALRSRPTSANHLRGCHHHLHVVRRDHMHVVRPYSG